MGIWPPFADGTDINALDVSLNNRLVRLRIQSILHKSKYFFN